MKYYSPANNGFYDTNEYPEDMLPEDVVELTEAQYAACFSPTNYNGIIVNEDGIPVPKPDTPEQILDKQKAAISEATRQTILGGFTSDALGTLHSYPSQELDQQNLAASVVDSLINAATPGWTTKFACADADGVWEYRDHTAAQIQEVAMDGKAFILTQLLANDQQIKAL